MQLDPRSEANLQGVHPDLKRIVERIKPPHKIVIIDGVRNLQTQVDYVETGKSHTLNSRHLTGHAIDFAVFEEGSTNQVTWDFQKYQEVAEEFKRASKILGIPITWGGDWEKIRDGGHIQLTWKDYPLATKADTKPVSMVTSTTVAAAGGISVVAVLQELLEMLEVVQHPWAKYASLAVTIVLAGYIVRERLIKVERDGV